MRSVIGHSIIGLAVALVGIALERQEPSSSSGAQFTGFRPWPEDPGDSDRGRSLGRRWVDRHRNAIDELDAMIYRLSHPSSGKSTARTTPVEELATFREIIRRTRNKDQAGQTVSDEERYDTAVAVIRLMRSGYTVEDAAKWLDDAFFKTLHARLETKAAVLAGEKKALRRKIPQECATMRWRRFFKKLTKSPMAASWRRRSRNTRPTCRSRKS